MWNPAAVCSSTHAVQPFPKWAGERVNGKHTEFMGDIKAIRSIRHDYALVNLCWLFPVAIFSFMCWKQLPGRFFFYNFPGNEANSYLHWSQPSWLGAMFAFFQSLHSHSCHNLSNTTKSSLTSPPHSSFISLLYTPCDPENLCISIWLECSIIPSFFVVGNASLCQWTHGSGRPENSLTTANANRQKKNSLWPRKSLSCKLMEGRKVSLHVALF